MAFTRASETLVASRRPIVTVRVGESAVGVGSLRPVVWIGDQPIHDSAIGQSSIRHNATADSHLATTFGFTLTFRAKSDL